MRVESGHTVDDFLQLLAECILVGLGFFTTATFITSGGLDLILLVTALGPVYLFMLLQVHELGHLVTHLMFSKDAEFTILGWDYVYTRGRFTLLGAIASTAAGPLAETLVVVLTLWGVWGSFPTLTLSALGLIWLSFAVFQYWRSDIEDIKMLLIWRDFAS